MTEARPFQPLADRLAGLPVDETLHDGVPAWLIRPLRESIQAAFVIMGDDAEGERLARRVLLRLRQQPGPSQQYRAIVWEYAEKDLLTVDALLQLHPGWQWANVPGGVVWARFLGFLNDLDGVLADGGALYQVDRAGHCLVRRVDPTVQAAADKAIAATTPTAADHLRTAWASAYGLHPDPDKAYDSAILALEELTCPLVCPNNPRRSLGTVIADLGNQAAHWELAMEDNRTGQPADINSLVQMLDLLWKVQSRHGGSPNSRPQTQAEAEAAVHLAATLTHWLSIGLLRRRP